VSSTVSELERALTVGSTCLFVSPHLDDAVLSCGALLTALARPSRVTVVTVFTEAGPPPHTRAARSFLRRCGIDSAEQLYVERRREDSEVLGSLGVQPVNLGFVDALFRRKQGWAPASSRVGRVLPELVHRYPTYRFDISKGRVSRGDQWVIQQAADRLLEIISRDTPELVFCPLAVGRHVDHVIVRDIARRHLNEVIYYAEFPYLMTAGSEREFRQSRSLEPWVWGRMLEVKPDLIAAYQTQMKGLFPDGVVPLMPEVYYFAQR
jgi:LmbE family N-acetylglucosaminyl deacetylase